MKFQSFTLCCRSRLVTYSRPVIMGILNVTPDSFYDGGRYLTDEQWQKMLEDKKAPAQPTWFAPLLIDEKIEADETFLYSSGC